MFNNINEIKELEKIQPENPLRYKKLNIEY